MCRSYIYLLSPLAPEWRVAGQLYVTLYTRIHVSIYNMHVLVGSLVGVLVVMFKSVKDFWPTMYNV
jgi:hypothetical protein